MINQFTIYGERHSGTNFLQNFIIQSFNLPYTEQFGHKHFFTPLHLENQSIDDTIFFCITRNPYDWLVAIFKRPHHCGFAYKDLKQFLLHEWWSKIEFTNNEIYEDRNWNNGQRYKNIFELRSNKLKYLYDLRFYQKYLLQFENFLNLKNTIYIKHNISAQFQIVSYPHKIMFKRPKNHFLSINEDVFNTINDNIDWTTEKLLGYQPFNSYEEFLQAYSVLT
jgi:hypothetical protein